MSARTPDVTQRMAEPAALHPGVGGDLDHDDRIDLGDLNFVPTSIVVGSPTVTNTPLAAHSAGEVEGRAGLVRLVCR
jgi:hypothetical protein